MKPIIYLTLLAGLCGCGGGSAPSSVTPPDERIQYSQTVSLAANTWVLGKPEQSSQLVTEQGIRGWQQHDDVLALYLYFRHTGRLQLALSGQVAAGQSQLELSLGEQRQTVTLKAGPFSKQRVADFNVSQLGYQRIELRGVSSQSAEFASLDSAHLAGPAAEGVVFIKDDVYWGRRGPSVHLSYQLPDTATSQWFYNEMHIPVGQDPVGSYFMATGFADGYFGIQVNSATERRVLFSVWSPYQTDDPSTIPPEQQVRLLRKGPAVQSGEFGNEGSGGQSFLRSNWQAGTTYGFLLKAEPVANNFTQYSAWFYPPEQGQWQLIASFARPDTQRYIERPHSFLENFLPEMGDRGRSVWYPAPWFAGTDGQWKPSPSVRFSVDNTGERGNRLDYKGGVTSAGAMLQNGGFFSDSTAPGTDWSLTPPAQPPVIDLTALP